MKWSAKTISVAVAAIVVLGAAGFIIARSGPALGQSFTIGYVDMAKAIGAHPRKASAEGALRDYAQSQIADAQTRMKGMPAAQQQDIQRQVQADILKKRQELIGGLEKDIRTAVEKIAKQQGVTIVLNREVVLYGGVDLTDQVIKAVSGK
ncbi:MAG TPA: OmpH family outer membrane protein [bacterium]|nr:OmpH family outer membrane protein [bacterium]